MFLEGRGKPDPTRIPLWGLCADYPEARPDRLAVVMWGRPLERWQAVLKAVWGCDPLKSPINLAQCTRRPSLKSFGPSITGLGHFVSPHLEKNSLPVRSSGLRGLENMIGTKAQVGRIMQCLQVNFSEDLYKHRVSRQALF